jgi:peptidyl-prolyl cis-trans isomerase C
MPEAAYLTLKLAAALYHKSSEALAPDERRRVDRVAARQLEIERRILSSPEAGAVVVPVAATEQKLQEIRDRYASPEEFRADLVGNGLTEAALAAAVERDVRLEAVLEQVASRAAEVTDTDAEIFYLLNTARFRRPESRTLRHILVTVNDAQRGSERTKARAGIEAIRNRLARSPHRFAEEAARYSECPTALNGGLLGDVRRGQLFPELEAVAFALKPGQISGVTESPLGFHLILCDAAEAECLLPLAAARQKIRAHLAEVRRRNARQAWIAGLR